MPRRLGRLKTRPDFLRLTATRTRFVTPGVILQTAPNPAPERSGRFAEARRVGFTASKKVGNAVARNRAKRRLRAAVQAVMADHAMPDRDYVLVARDTTPGRRWPDLLADVENGLRRLKSWR